MKGKFFKDSVINFMYSFLKRLFDILVSLLAMIPVTLITFIVFVLNNICDNKGPLFYKQRRIGKNGIPFYIYKYRTMVMDADEILKKNTKLYHEYIQNGYKLSTEKDPRITKFGELLRKSSVDEIPQFYNILKGDMSLVGPRPVVEEELVEYGKNVKKFLSVVPGAMGYWQAIGRSDIMYPERCEVELYYVDNASLGFDFKIIFKCITSIFLRKGAY